MAQEVQAQATASWCKQALSAVQSGDSIRGCAKWICGFTEDPRSGSSWKTCSGQSTSVASSSSLSPAQWCRQYYRWSHCPLIAFAFRPHGRLGLDIEGSLMETRLFASLIQRVKTDHLRRGVGVRRVSTRQSRREQRHGGLRGRMSLGRWSTPSWPVNQRGPYGVRSTFLSRGPWLSRCTMMSS